MSRELKQTPFSRKTGGASAPPVLPHVLVPEILDERKSGDPRWSVRDSNALTGSTDPKARTMAAPLLDASAQANAVRVHELMHARLTPQNLMEKGQKKYGCAEDSLQACEDLRLNLAARQQGVTALYETPVTGDQVVEIITSLVKAAKAVEGATSLYSEAASKLYHKAACCVVALWQTQHGSLALSTLDSLDLPRDVRYASHYAINELNYSRSDEFGVRSPNATIRAAMQLDPILKRHKVLAERAAEQAEREIDRKATGGDPSNTVAQKPPEEIAGEDCKVMIDHLRVFHPPLSVPLRKKARMYRRTSDVGALWRPTEAMRLDGTGVPFRRKLKTHGCAVLIDSSGSMGFGHSQLAEIIREVPGALVMLHASSCFYDEGVGELGTFAVVGQDGRIINEFDLEGLREEQLGGGNCNDAACVLLAGQLANKLRIAGPRFWVTDRGWGNHQGVLRIGNTVQVCERAARQAKFHIVPKIGSIWA